MSPPVYTDNLTSTKDISPGAIIIYFDDEYNRKIKKLPPTVKFITFGHKFNRSIKIPNGVISVTFGDEFNKPIKSCFPDTLKFIEFGKNFNQPINDLPDTVEQVILGDNYNLPIPKNLIHIKSNIYRRLPRFSWV